MTTALIIFVLMYAGMLIFSKWRVWFAVGAAACMIIFGVLPVGAVLSNINWNVIMMIAGTMGLVTLFVETGMPSRLARSRAAREMSVRGSPSGARISGSQPAALRWNAAA